MYDLSQLNDLLVPELLDIAAQQKIITSKKQSREELITLILEKQDLPLVKYVRVNTQTKKLQ